MIEKRREQRGFWHVLLVDPLPFSFVSLPSLPYPLPILNFMGKKTLSGNLTSHYFFSFTVYFLLVDLLLLCSDSSLSFCPLFSGSHFRIIILLLFTNQDVWTLSTFTLPSFPSLLLTSSLYYHWYDMIWWSIKLWYFLLLSYHTIEIDRDYRVLGWRLTTYYPTI